MNVQEYLKKKLGNVQESDQALENQAMVDELAKKQAEAQALSEKTSQYGDVLNLTRALAMNPDVKGPEEFIKRRQEEINQPVEALKDRQKTQMTLSEQVRDHLMRGLTAQEGEKQRLDTSAARKQGMEMDAERFAHQKLMDEMGLGLRERELGQKMAKEEADAAKKATELPDPERKFVDALATKNANKVSIKSQLDAFMESWDSLPDDQKVTQGRQLLKVLNSAEGADAIGAEEAKRLGAKLDFAMGNFTNSNPMQFGRDLEGFAQQVRDTAGTLGKAISTNDQIIASKYAKYGAPYKADLPGVPSSSTSGSGLTPEQRRARIQQLRAKVK